MRVFARRKGTLWACLLKKIKNQVLTEIYIYTYNYYAKSKTITNVS